MTFTGYLAEGFFDEMIGEDGQPRASAKLLAREIESLPAGELEARQQTAERALLQAGITFNVYSDNRAVEKTLPFDRPPRTGRALGKPLRATGAARERGSILLLFSGHSASRADHRETVHRSHGAFPFR